MDLITKSLQELQWTIPREVLKLAYMDKIDFRTAPISLEEQIRRKTIMARVYVDTNIAGGETIIVDLKGIGPKLVDEFNYIFEVPPERVNHRTILTALSVNYMNTNQLVGSLVPGYSNAVNSGSDVTHASQRAMDSRSSIPIVSNSDCLMVGHNVVMVRNHMRTAAVVQLRCVVTNDERLSNISIRSAPMFSKLCQLAVKSFIYNEMVIKLDRGYLDRGQELGSIKAYIDNLADAEEMYQTYLTEQWGAVGIMNDRLTVDDLMHIQLSPGI